MGAMNLRSARPLCSGSGLNPRKRTVVRDRPRMWQATCRCLQSGSKPMLAAACMVCLASVCVRYWFCCFFSFCFSQYWASAKYLPISPRRVSKFLHGVHMFLSPPLEYSCSVPTDYFLTSFSSNVYLLLSFFLYLFLER